MADTIEFITEIIMEIREIDVRKSGRVLVTVEDEVELDLSDLLDGVSAETMIEAYDSDALIAGLVTTLGARDVVRAALDGMTRDEVLTEVAAILRHTAATHTADAATLAELRNAVWVEIDNVLGERPAPTPLISSYGINVAKKGEHVFRTDRIERKDRAKEVFAELCARFPAKEGYVVQATGRSDFSFAVDLSWEAQS